MEFLKVFKNEIENAINIKTQENITNIFKFKDNSLFEPYFTTKDNKGTGLGLSSIYGFIRKENGFLMVSSELAFGTTITMFLPRCR